MLAARRGGSHCTLSCKVWLAVFLLPDVNQVRSSTSGRRIPPRVWQTFAGCDLRRGGLDIPVAEDDHEPLDVANKSRLSVQTFNPHGRLTSMYATCHGDGLAVYLEAAVFEE